MRNGQARDTDWEDADFSVTDSSNVTRWADRLQRDSLDEGSLERLAAANIDGTDANDFDE